MSIAEKLLEELRAREDLRRALAEELLPELFRDRRLRIAVLTALYRDIATKQDLDRLRNELSERISDVNRRLDSLVKWIIGLILGMWISIMLTLIPILLRILRVV